MRMWAMVLAVVATAGMGLSVLAAEVPPVTGEVEAVTGEVEAVTVYRGQALVTRVVALGGPAGLREVVVSELPDRIVPGSIYAESADGVEVRSVRYRVRPVRQDVRKEVRELDERIRQVLDELDANERRQDLIGEKRGYLVKLEQFVAPTANVELTKGVLNAETLERLTHFLFEMRERWANQELELGLEQRELSEQVELLERKRKKLTGSSARSVREAVVFVNVQKGEGARLRLRYLVERASWSPSYNIRTGADHGEVVVEYNASIQQMSGEDWTDVAMTLSTATPSLVAKAPALTPLTVMLKRAEPPGKQLAAGRYFEKKRELGDRVRQMEALRNAPMPQSNRLAQQQVQRSEVGQFVEGFMVDLERADKNLNVTAGDLQVLELGARGRIRRPSKRVAPKVEEGVSVTYELEGRTTLPSRADQQLIQIASLPMKGQFYKLATPVLTSYVYDEARIKNGSKMVLLAGPVSSFVDGQFVGHGSIPTVARGQSFTAGFGIDSSLRAGRELLEREETVQGGNRVATFTYRLSVENFGGAPAAVRLLDRLPKAKGKDLKVTLLPLEVKLSKDRGYLKTQRKQDILRWDLEVAAGASGLKAFGVDYKFKLEYDKQMSIGGLPAK